MDVCEFDFDLPSELIAQEPSADRGAARLLCLDRRTGATTSTAVAALPNLLTAGDLIVVNNTRVFPARLIGRRVPSGGAVECLLLERVADQGGAGQGGPHGDDPHRNQSGAGRWVPRNERSEQRWEALVHPG